MTIKNLIEEFNNITLMKVFEIEVIEKKNNEKDFIVFDISIDGEKNILRAEHVALNTQEEESNKIAFKSIDLDDCFTLDEHLQQLSEVCTEAIMQSEFYQLAD